MPETRIPGRMYPSGHAHEGVHALLTILEDWFSAIEDGSVRYRLPDPSYQRSGGRPTWTEAELNTLIRDIDAEISSEVGRAPGTSTGSNAGPGFSRLELPQRLALAQVLDQAVSQYDGVFPATTNVTVN